MCFINTNTRNNETIIIHGPNMRCHIYNDTVTRRIPNEHVHRGGNIDSLGEVGNCIYPTGKVK